ncbi:CRISPR-associated endonuclease Cas2 [Chitinilyticum piscinae]|uniref:CRISPR-associated endoribonuclease Cas2 n=1 Tax=Chitinilyticum piscinae TaxID=2866724 RepID=A0A8J7G3P2_9NEIS|nr:CRISPR-associated endonuclease Cas2 [Chitinilyticum piscinae]MBE9610838.1 CRISPR-associated endonuclease Cas2 [Chitinilyticum piscinae]
MSNLYLIAYDISHRQRHYRVARELEGWGLRVQESVFECWLTAPKLTELRRNLARLIDPRCDLIRYYPLCPKDVPLIRTLGPATRASDVSHYQLG